MKKNYQSKALPTEARYKVSALSPMFVRWFDSLEEARTYYGTLRPQPRTNSEQLAVLWDTSTEPWTMLQKNFN